MNVPECDHLHKEQYLLLFAILCSIAIDLSGEAAHCLRMVDYEM